jgi:hypothetical protein
VESPGEIHKAADSPGSQSLGKLKFNSTWNHVQLACVNWLYTISI